jgi:hypothetical protein
MSSLDLTLRRDEFRSDGILSSLIDPDGKVLCRTLTHAYPQPGGSYAPKVPNGRYRCKYGLHRIGSSLRAINTFEVTGVVGHAGILFHPGNRNEDSVGCELPGVIATVLGGVTWVSNSGVAWGQLMARQGTADFWLTVTGGPNA